MMSNGLRNFGSRSTLGRGATAILFHLPRSVEYLRTPAVSDLYTTRSDHADNGSGNGISFFARWTEKRCIIQHHEMSPRHNAQAAAVSHTPIVHITTGTTEWESDRQADVDCVLYAYN